jgi:putative NADPH-quinone reductase
MRSKISVIQGHPDSRGGHFCHALADAYARGAHEAGHTVRVVDVGTLEFPLLRSRQDLESGVTPESIQEAQSRIAWADHLVVIYPVWNGGLPALFKGFLEQTFRPAFMFPDARPDQPLGFVSALKQRTALHGKTARIVATMQMPAFVYRWYFHPHPEKNTLKLSGIKRIRETLIGLVESPDRAKRERWLRRIHAFGSEAR